MTDDRRSGGAVLGRLSSRISVLAVAAAAVSACTSASHDSQSSTAPASATSSTVAPLRTPTVAPLRTPTVVPPTASSSAGAFADAPVMQGLRGSIAYSGPGGHIWTVNAATGERRQITTGDGGVDFDPHWSPDGRHLVFRTERFTAPDPTSTGYMGIFVVASDGTGEHAVNPPGGGLFPAWTTEGDRIVFSGPRPDGSEGLFSVRPDGTGLTDLKTYGEHIEWSPDGRSVLVDRNVDVPTGQNWEIWRGPSADVRKLVRLTNATGDDHFGAWSPDGRAVVFSTQRRDAGDVWLMNSDGTSQRALIAWDGSQGAEGWIACDRVVFADHSAETPRWFVVAPDGSSLSRLPLLNGIEGPVSWHSAAPRTGNCG